MSQAAFHKLEDHFCSSNSREQKQSRTWASEAVASVDLCKIEDPYAPYSTCGTQTFKEHPSERADLYDDDDGEAGYHDDISKNWCTEVGICVNAPYDSCTRYR